MDVVQAEKLFQKTEQKNSTNLRKHFDPMFKFLEQEQKDFNGLEAYKSSVYIKKW